MVIMPRQPLVPWTTALPHALVLHTPFACMDKVIGRHNLNSVRRGKNLAVQPAAMSTP
jgi:hypothetical protein